jgi:rSAM/selenodomain-associated transferase 1
LSENALVVFVKRPAPGAVKTRLAATIGRAAAARLHRALAEHVLESTTPRAGEYERLVFFDPPDALADMRAWLPGVRLLPQSSGDLGDRMADAFARAFARGARRVAIVGTDTPDVSRETVTEALAALEASDVVIGPAEDGGYYLLALKTPRRELFSGIAWSTPSVCAETQARAGAAGLSVCRLRPLRDVDTLDDLRAAWGRVGPVLEKRRSLGDEIARALRGSGRPPADGSNSPGRV